MIARIWRGIVPAEKSGAYFDLMRSVALPDYKATPGSQGAWCLRRDRGTTCEFEMISIWRDLDAIRSFAGDEVEFARYYDFDDAYLAEKEMYARHFEVYQQ